MARLRPSYPRDVGYFGEATEVTPSGIVAERRPYTLNGAVYLYDFEPLLPVSSEPAPTDAPGTTLGIESVRPNPSSREAVVRYPTVAEGLIVLVLLDALAREMAKFNEALRTAGVYEVRFDVSALPAGVYAIRVESGGSSAVRRFVVVH